MSDRVASMARLWYQDNTNGQLLIGEVAWSPEGELVALLPVCDERMQRIATYAQWPELQDMAADWFESIKTGGLDEYRQRTETTGNMMSVLHCGDLQPLFWDDWTMEEAREWMVKVIAHAK